MSKLSDMLQKKTETVKPNGLSAAAAPLTNSAAKTVLPVKTNPLDSLLVQNSKPAQPKVYPSHQPVARQSADPLAGLADIEMTITNDAAAWPSMANDLPEGDEVAAQMAALINGISDAMMTDDISTVLKETMTFLSDNPNMKDLLMPEDISILVRGLQQSHGVVIAKKVAKKTNTRKKKASTEAVMSDLADLDF